MNVRCATINPGQFSSKLLFFEWTTCIRFCMHVPDRWIHTFVRSSTNIHGPNICLFSQVSVSAAKSDAERARREFAARRQAEQQNILDRLREQLSLLEKELAAAKSKAAMDISRAQVRERLFSEEKCVKYRMHH